MMGKEDNKIFSICIQSKTLRYKKDKKTESGYFRHSFKKIIEK